MRKVLTAVLTIVMTFRVHKTKNVTLGRSIFEGIWLLLEGAK